MAITIRENSQGKYSTQRHICRNMPRIAALGLSPRCRVEKEEVIGEEGDQPHHHQPDGDVFYLVPSGKDEPEGE